METGLRCGNHPERSRAEHSSSLLPFLAVCWRSEWLSTMWCDSSTDMWPPQRLVSTPVSAEEQEKITQEIFTSLACQWPFWEDPCGTPTRMSLVTAGHVLPNCKGPGTYSWFCFVLLFCCFLRGRLLRYRDFQTWHPLYKLKLCAETQNTQSVILGARSLRAIPVTECPPPT